MNEPRPCYGPGCPDCAAKDAEIARLEQLVTAAVDFLAYLSRDCPPPSCRADVECANCWREYLEALAKEA